MIFPHKTLKYSVKMDLFIRALFCLMFTCVAVRAQTPCITPIRESGNCVPITKCSLHVDLYKNGPKRLPVKMENYLKKSICGEIDGVYYVCCAPRHLIRNETSSTDNFSQRKLYSKRVIMRETKDFEDVEGHPSLGLVNQYGCGKNSGNKAHNGKNASPGEFPWVVQLQYPTSSGLAIRCSGSLINKQYVLTAAHCVARDPVVSVRLGEYDTSKDIDCSSANYDDCLPRVQDIPIEAIIIHPEFNNPTFSNDIAILRLQLEANISHDSVFPICLPTSPELQNANLDHVTVAGWRLSEKHNVSSILQNTVIPVVSNEKCQQLYQRSTFITPRQICVGGENIVDRCLGDLGGPLFFSAEPSSPRYIQYGLVSEGFRDCAEITTHPGIYTRVSYYMKWILDQMKP